MADPKRSPEETFTLGTSLDLNLGSLGATLRPFGSLRYIGANVVGTSNGGKQGSTTLWNAGVALVDNEGRWEVIAECRNCGNEVYFTSNLFIPYYTPPGAWNARVKFNF